MLRLRSFLVVTAFTAGLTGLTLSATGPASSVVKSLKAAGSHANASPSCRRSFNAYAAPKSFLARCGDRVFPLDRIESLQGGGRGYVYDVAGMRTVFFIPPKGFNPLTASARELAEYHYSPKPSGGQALRSWKSLVSRAHFLTPPRYLVAIYSLRTSRGVTNVKNTIWAGNMATECSTCVTYQDVYANWLEPHYDSTPCPSPVANSNWAGLGGWNTSTLVQGGTAVGEENDGVGSHQAWYSLVYNDKGATIPISGLYASPGGEFTAQVDHVSGGYNLLLENDVTGATTGNFFVSFDHFDGSTAEMITEDPDNGTLVGWNLEQFDPFTVEDAEASRDGVNYRGLASYDHDNVIMWDWNYADEMANAGGAYNSGDSWPFYYDNCS